MTVAVTVTAEQAPEPLPEPEPLLESEPLLAALVEAGISMRVTVLVLVLLIVEVRVEVVSSAGLVTEAPAELVAEASAELVAAASAPDSVYIKVSSQVPSIRYQI